MFSLTVSDHVMVAHSFRGEAFGPAQRLHGATFVVEAEFRAATLHPLGWLVDIGRARAALRAILERSDYRNLDDLAEVAGRNTTTEMLAAHVHAAVSAACREGTLGPGAERVTALKVTLRESPLAWAAFEGPVA